VYTRGVTRLAGKIALVTGGSSGIGAASARALAAEGAAVVAAARRFARGGLAIPRPGEIDHTHLDVTDEAAVDALVAMLPALDVLVCSHGTGTFEPIVESSAAGLREMLEIHVVGTMLCARAALRRMKRQRSGHIVVIGSHAAHHAFVDCGGYTAAKAGQLGFARVLAAEARPHDVRVTALLPGATDTPIWDDRPGFDRSKMMKPNDVAELLVELVARPAIAVDEVVVTPPAGVL
jgi:NAD(P)-dependent dehydrogenase (short-subunit alcohol dehydrogenase family)